MILTMPTKNRVDTDKLFSNLQDLRNIMDDYTFIDDEQEEAIRQFFHELLHRTENSAERTVYLFMERIGEHLQRVP